MFNTTQQVRDFVFAGRATLTAKSLRTGRHFTYKFKTAKGKDWPFVFVLRDHGKYDYIGMIDRNLNVHFTKKSKLLVDDIKVKALQFIAKNLTSDRISNNIELSHNGKCGKCGRKLTHPNSLKLGIGPECQKKKQTRYSMLGQW